MNYRNLNRLSCELATLVALNFRILIWNFGHVNSSVSRELVALVALIFRILIWNFGHPPTPPPTPHTTNVWFGIYIYIYIYIPQTALALEGFLLLFYRISLGNQDCPVPPTCLDLPRLSSVLNPHHLSSAAPVVLQNRVVWDRRTVVTSRQDKPGP